MRAGQPEGEIEEAICNCHVGMYGICIDDIGKDGRFHYMIAGPYTEGKIPAGMSLYEIPELEWAKFMCKGPLPGALQSLNYESAIWIPVKRK